MTASLLDQARAAAQHAYAPYSRFRVGAAVRAADGSVHTGANVENASYGLTLCAERSAVARAAGAGLRSLSEVAIWVDARDPAPPCGACLQVLAEFCLDPSSTKVTLGAHGGAHETTLAALLPRPFRLGADAPEP